MDSEVATIDLTSLRAELKVWEREFKAKKGREPTREDIKKAPAIDAKYKAYNKSRSKAEKTASNTQQDAKEKRQERKGQGSSRPSPTASSATAVESVGGVEETFNPFRSPKKGGPSVIRPPAKRKSSIFTDEDPFAAGDEQTTPTSSLFAKLQKSSPAHNPFGSPARKPLFMTAGLPVSSPSKSILKPTPTTTPLSHVQPDATLPASKYVQASSPSKLRALIQQTKAADTPRTKARKRLAGEEDFTPDKRRRLSSLRPAVVKGLSSEDEPRDEEQEDEGEIAMEVDEQFGPTPKKVDPPRRFRPIFDSPMKQAGKGIFSKRTVSFTVPSSSQRGSSQPPDLAQPGLSLKRPASPDPAASKPSTSAGLIPPSPPPAGTSSKAKPRKRPKKTKKSQSKEAAEDSSDSSEPESQIKEVPYSLWGGLRATRRHAAPGEDASEDEIWDFDVRRPDASLSLRAADEEVEEEMTVRLPTDMFGLLDLESPVKPRREVEELVRGIFQPGRKHSTSQVVYGAGQFEELGEGEDEVDEDWQEEVDGWKGEAGLDDF